LNIGAGFAIPGDRSRRFVSVTQALRQFRWPHTQCPARGRCKTLCRNGSPTSGNAAKRAVQCSKRGGALLGNRVLKLIQTREEKSAMPAVPS